MIANVVAHPTAGDWFDVALAALFLLGLIAGAIVFGGRR